MIYICIPTHNEQQTVGVVLWKLREVLTRFPRDYQLLVADDASTDKTALVLEPYARVLPLTVIRAERQLGEAASLELLLREAVRRSEYPKRDVIVTLQADFSDEPDDIVPLIKRIEAGADVAIGNKVSKTVAPRLRRLSRALANLFARGTKWPADAESPFDGFRAYRLYAIKRALETRPGRLIRYGGWAGQAELLQYVLPHARRVDGVVVVDRTDRLQRERREQPFASAMSVRAMRRGVEPAGLVPVEELDRIAATASRTRDRSLLLEEAAQKSKSAGRSNGGSRARSGGGRSDRSDRSRAGAGSSAKRERPRSGEPRERTSAGEKKRTRGGRNRSATGETGGKAAAEAAPAVTEEKPVPSAAGAAGETAAPKKKRRRRRKRRSSASGAGNAQNAAEPAQNAEGAAGDGGESPRDAKSAPRDTPRLEAGASPGAGPDSASDAADGTATAEPGTSPKKRRRRGGRRGGRGRKRGPRADSGETPQDSSGGDGASGAADAGSGPVAGRSSESPAE